MARIFRRKFNKYIKRLRNTLCTVVTVTIMLIFVITAFHQKKVIKEIPIDAMKYLEFEKADTFEPLSINDLKRLIEKHNSEQHKHVLNLEVFGPLKEDTIIFVVNVEEYSTNFKYLLVSLSKLWGIEDVLIIFSHLYFDENLNRLIRSIDFARVLQIYYPYSIRLYPHEFPGFHPKDCKYDMGVKAAESANCTGASYPDIHGLYRQPEKSQNKHFWWWTLNEVFENISFISGHIGTVVFLDDDLYLLEDFIYMIVHLKKISGHLFQCDFISLETPNFSFNLKKKPWEVDLKTWDPSEHANVLAFGPTVWDSISSQYDLFCSVDDFSWSRSLYYLSLNRKVGERFKVMSTILPRAFSTRYCAIYGKLLDCDVIEAVYQAMNVYVRDRKLDIFFPVNIEIFVHLELEYDDLVMFDDLENNGGWSDPRDKRMCHHLTKTKIKKNIMAMESELHAMS